MKLDGMILTDTVDQEVVKMFLVMFILLNDFIKTWLENFALILQHN